MKIIKKTRLRFTYGGKGYIVPVNSIQYNGALIVNKLRVGHAHLWLVLQDGVWRFISDMPLCRELKTILLQKVASLHGLITPTENPEQVPLRTGILFNAILNLLALKRELPV